MNKFKTFFIYFLGISVFIAIGWFANTAYHLPRNSNPIAQVRPTPLAKYTIENLAKSYSDIKPSEISIGKILKAYPKFNSHEFTMKFSPDLSDNLKTTSGVINIPNETGSFPVVVMFRGYVDPTQYFMGEGTQPVASVFASNGFITIAPDFLGYGDSDHEATDVFESRFQTYTTAMVTLKSVSSIKNWDGKNIFIWGHSNGGQITLTTLEITGVTYPAVLWAPVSMSFPGSILYYTIEADDSGKSLTDFLAKFDENYDPTKYSLTNYLNLIKAPIQLNQGTNDQEVPYWITDNFNKELKTATVSATYIKYPGNDHNMDPNWNSVIKNNLQFFEKYL